MVNMYYRPGLGEFMFKICIHHDVLYVFFSLIKYNITTKILNNKI